MLVNQPETRGKLAEVMGFAEDSGLESRGPGMWREQLASCWARGHGLRWRRCWAGEAAELEFRPETRAGPVLELQLEGC